MSLMSEVPLDIRALLFDAQRCVAGWVGVQHTVVHVYGDGPLHIQIMRPTPRVLGFVKQSQVARVARPWTLDPGPWTLDHGPCTLHPEP